MANTKNPSAVSAGQFAALRKRVKDLEDWKVEVDKKFEELAEGDIDVEEAKGLFRRVMSYHPYFAAATLVMIGFVLGCIICDFHTFGGY